MLHEKTPPLTKILDFHHDLTDMKEFKLQIPVPWTKYWWVNMLYENFRFYQAIFLGRGSSEQVLNLSEGKCVLVHHQWNTLEIMLKARNHKKLLISGTSGHKLMMSWLIALISWPMQHAWAGNCSEVLVQMHSKNWKQQIVLVSIHYDGLSGLE